MAIRNHDGGKHPQKRSAFPEQNRGEIPSDVLGSYTGMSRDGDRPVQDADDL